MIDFYADYDVQMHFLAFILGATRLTVFAFTAPVMGNAVLNATTRSAVILALYLLIHPSVLVSLSELGPMESAADSAHFALLIVKEVFIGFLLGWLSGLVFWAIESAGLFIDNQRGAGMATQSDPMTAEQTSPTGSFLFQSTAYVFFASGCFVVMLALVFSTYEFWPVSEFLPGAFFTKQGAALFFGEKLAVLATNIVLISAPVVIACLFTDIALGLINRFASQLNVYILAMPIKSALASFLLIFYFAILMTDAPERFAEFGVDLSGLRAWMR